MLNKFSVPNSFSSPETTIGQISHRCNSYDRPFKVNIVQKNINFSRNRVKKRGRKTCGKRVFRNQNPLFDFGTPQIFSRENSLTGEPFQRNGFNSSSYIENLIRREFNSESGIHTL